MLVANCKVITFTYQQIHEQNGNHHTEETHNGCRELWDRSKRGPSLLAVQFLCFNYNVAIINLTNHHNKCLDKGPKESVENSLRVREKFNKVAHFDVVLSDRLNLVIAEHILVPRATWIECNKGNPISSDVSNSL